MKIALGFARLFIAFVVACVAQDASVPIGSTAAAAEASGAIKNYCDKGVDDAACASCAGKDCKIGAASALAKTGFASVLFDGWRIDVTPARGDGLLKIENSAEDQYIVYVRPLPANQTDSSRICTVNITGLDNDHTPSEALALLGKFDPAAHVGQVLARTSFTYDGFTGFDSIVASKSGGYSLMRDVVYRNLYLDKSCEYSKRPAQADGHWDDLRITFARTDEPRKAN